MRLTILITLLTSLMAVIGQVRTETVYLPGENDDHYVNNAVITWYKGNFYCMWQSSSKDEDAPDTHVRMSRSRNGRRWSTPVTIAGSSDTTFASPGGWIVHKDTLTAFINVMGDIKTGGNTRYITTTDGRTWSGQKPVMMADGKAMEGIMEQDPHLIDGRLIGAAHFRPGLKARPIYTDDLSGHGGWHIGEIDMEDRGSQSRGIEPSLFTRPDGTIVMLFRDQASSFRKIASESTDMGMTWSKPYLTELIDSRSKQCAGNLPDGTAFIISNPAESKDRTTLGIAFSKDGRTFSPYHILRSPEDLPERQYDGRYKTLGYSYPKAFQHKNRLYVSYSENKERIAVTTIRIRTDKR